MRFEGAPYWLLCLDILLFLTNSLLHICYCYKVFMSWSHTSILLQVQLLDTTNIPKSLPEPHSDGSCTPTKGSAAWAVALKYNMRMPETNICANLLLIHWYSFSVSANKSMLPANLSFIYCSWSSNVPSLSWQSMLLSIGSMSCCQGIIVASLNDDAAKKEIGDSIQ